MAKQTVTLQMIADRAGVNRATVSRALRNHPRYSRATCSKIQKIAAQMGYQPNAFARNLSSLRHSNNENISRANLACIVGHTDRDPMNTHIAYQQMFNGAQQKAHQLGYSMEYFWAYDPQFSQKKMNRILRARGVLGVLLISIHESELDLNWDFYACASCQMGASLPSEFSQTQIDWSKMTKLAMAKLITQGYQNIGLILSNYREIKTEGLISGAFQFVKKHHHLKKSSAFYFDFDKPEEVEQIKLDIHHRKEVMGIRQKDLRKLYPWHFQNQPHLNQKMQEGFLRWLKKTQPEVLLTWRPDNIELFSRLKNLGIRVPQDIKVVGLDLLNENEKQAGVYSNYPLLGAAATDLIAEQLTQNEKGIPKIPKQVTIPPTWKIGKGKYRLPTGPTPESNQ